MDLISLLIIVIIFGLLFWAIGVLPIPAPFKTVAYVILVVILVLWLVGQLGYVDMPRLRHR